MNDTTNKEQVQGRAFLGTGTDSGSVCWEIDSRRATANITLRIRHGKKTLKMGVWGSADTKHPLVVAHLADIDMLIDQLTQYREAIQNARSAS